MGPYNEFAIINKIEMNRDYSLSQIEKFDVVRVSDDYVNKWVNNLKSLDTSWHTIANNQKGLARYGVTLIPPTSLGYFKNVIISFLDKNIDTDDSVISLMRLIEQAKSEDKYIIHFGI